MTSMQNYKEVDLTKDGALKCFKGESSLYFNDIKSSIKSMTPGEWVVLKDTKKQISYLAFANPLVANSSPCAHLLKKLIKAPLAPETELKELLEKAIAHRSLFSGYEGCSRFIFGGADSLPGLIVDSYLNAIVIQINLAGIELHREFIKSFFKERFNEKKVIFLDNEKYREREFLPIHSENSEKISILAEENGLTYKVQEDVIQKVGFYYDHRENRQKLRSLLKRMKHNYKSGIDLFSYVGAWGLSLLAEGIEKVDFVDQGDFELSVLENITENGFSNIEGCFFRQNVFDFLKESKSTYDVVCCDPPAFCKSKKEAKKAYEGYSRLHRLALQKVNDGGLFAASSCTQYISHDDFNKNVVEAAKALNIHLRLLDFGMQGFDHPCKHFSGKESYLKYFVFKVEKL